MFGLGGRGPGNWCSELSGRTQSRRQLSAQLHFASTGAMTSARPVLEPCCDSNDSTGVADLLMGWGRSTGHCADLLYGMASLPGQFTAPE